MNAPIADVVSLMEQMNDNLDISVDKAPAAFDMIQKGTEGTRTTAAGTTKGLADLPLQMRGLGESGEKGLRSTLGLLIASASRAISQAPPVPPPPLPFVISQFRRQVFPLHRRRL